MKRQGLCTYYSLVTLSQGDGIHVTGETVQAKNLVLDSASDINLAAGKNTVDVKDTYKSSGWSVGAFEY
ncbi:MAG: hemagglutinin repeat-containing protein [Veillonella atypica]